MNFEIALSERAADDPVLSGALAAHGGWSRRLQKLPGLTFEIITDPRPQHFKGFQRTRQTTVQIDAWAATPLAVVALRDVMISILTPPLLVGTVRFQRAMIEASRLGQETEQPGDMPRFRGELHRASTDFIFTHNAN